MPRDVPPIRIMPMSTKIPGFGKLTIDDVQRKLFLGRLPKMKGRFQYRSSGLNTEPGTLVLFQFRARVIGSALFLRDEKYEKPRDGCAGAMYFDVKSIRTFDPLDVEAMRKVWPTFRAFGHVKQYLNPTLYAAFKKRLKNVKSPVAGR